MASLAGGPAGKAPVSNLRIALVVALLGLSVLLNYVDRGAIGIAAPLMIKDLALNEKQFGFAVSAFFWVYAPLCLVVGWLCDRFCVYRMFAAGVALWALATVLTGFVHGIWLLIALRLVLGLGESIAFPGSSKIFATEVPAAHRGSANSVVAAALAFGPAVGTLAGGLILLESGWRAIFWVFGGITVLWLLPWHVVSAPLRSRNFAIPVTAPVPLKKILQTRTVWLMGIGHFATNYGFYFLLTWLPLFLVKSRGYSIADMTVLTTLGFAVQGIVALAMGRMSDRRVNAGAEEGALRRKLMVTGLALASAALAAVYFATDKYQLGAVLVLAGSASGLTSTNLFAIGQIFAGPRAAGGWIGVQNAIGNCAGIIGPIITGLIVFYLGGYGYAFAITAAVPALGAVWWAWVIPKIERVID